MATQILPIAAGAATSADITFAADTLVWVHGSRALNVSFAINVKGSDGLYADFGMLGAGFWSGVIPAGTYQFVRLSGNAGLQYA